MCEEYGHSHAGFIREYRFIHSRKPIILNPLTQKYIYIYIIYIIYIYIYIRAWLEGVKFYDFCNLMSHQTPRMPKYYKVSYIVNAVKNNNSDCILPLEEYKQENSRSA